MALIPQPTGAARLPAGTAAPSTGTSSQAPGPSLLVDLTHQESVATELVNDETESQLWCA